MDEATVSREPSSDRNAQHRHWGRPDPVGDILAIAWSPTAAEPREIRVRPEVYHSILAELDAAERALVEERGMLGSPIAIPLLVDAELPLLPGFEIVRARPHAAAA
ncbi:hypothetical protein FHU33_1638 [Blastococcus colisei]|uniref:Uncharacterized protein n=1 Tax=Blastococcus colisei TaxID=1564162 RepID=A0A543PDT6_9ACTN|nr:hypothetical protein [Blastococcus colisei]TQN42243.1 hypothetical protein FHU33_1638 [Blastococcus colisei]